MKRKQQDSTNKAIEQIYHTLQTTNTDTLTFIKHSITRLSPEDFFNLLKWQLDTYAYSPQKAREILSMSPTQLNYHIDTHRIKPLYSFNDYSIYQRIRIFYQPYIDNYAKEYTQYIHFYRSNQKNTK